MPSDGMPYTNRALFAGEHASFAHGRIQGAIGMALRCVKELIDPPALTGREGNRTANGNVTGDEMEDEV